MAILSGVIMGLSQPIVVESLGGKVPLDGTGLSGLLAFVGLIPLLVAIEGQGPKRSYGAAFITGLIAFSLVIHWIFTTVHVYGGLPLVVGFGTLFLLTGAIAAYVAAGFAVARVIARFYDVPQWLVLPPAVAAVELLRNYGPVGGFPWGSFGHAFATVPVFLQSASLFGVTGLTFCAVAVNAGLAATVHGLWCHRRFDARPFGMAMAVLVGMGIFGAIRLADDVVTGPSVRVALLQPNVNEGLADLNRETPRAIETRLHDAERAAIADGARLILWPEGSFPNRRLDRDTTSFAGKRLFPDDITSFPATVVGAASVGRFVDDEGKRRGVRHNSGFVVDDQLRVQGRFDKSHLVPFGEYVPWPFGGVIRQFIPLGTTTPGTHLQPIPLTLDGVTHQVGITICYEGVFPEIARSLANNGATFMANLTDDRWYGVSGMATQHLLMYALRAVESGRPVARSTNTGISAWVDVHGGLHHKTAMYESALVVDDFPLVTRDTLYLALGDWLAFLSLLGVLGAWFVAMLGGRAFLVRRRTPLVLALGVASFFAVVGGLVMWLTGDGMDEARSTKAMLLVLSGLLVGLGALSGRRWGRRAVLVVGALLAFFGALAMWLSGADKIIVVLVGLVVLILGRRHEVTVQAPSSSSSSSSSSSAGTEGVEGPKAGQA